MQIEADGIIALMENKKQKEIAKMTFTSGTLNGKELVVVVCGVGKVNAAMCSFAMIQNYKPDCIINSGVAGSVSEKVSVGDIVVAVNVVEHDMNTTALGDLQGEVSIATKRLPTNFLLLQINLRIQEPKKERLQAEIYLFLSVGKE